MNVKNASLAHVDDQVAALKSPLKAFALLMGIGWLTLISVRFTLLPDVAAGINPAVLLSPTLTLLVVVYAWTRISRPGLAWHYLLTAIGFGQLGWIAWLGGPMSL